jgi:hypothetical protein
LFRDGLVALVLVVVVAASASAAFVFAIFFVPSYRRSSISCDKEFNVPLVGDVTNVAGNAAVVVVAAAAATVASVGVLDDSEDRIPLEVS